MEAVLLDHPSLLPQPPAQVSRKPMWITLAAPTVLTLASGVVLLSMPNKGETFLLGVLMMVLGIVPGLSFHFHDAVAKRYRGISLAFLVCAYLLGQVII
ncbi:MAG: hypothetical protein EOP87_26860, partial [Verrucomicrobiaceae bacterium]